MLHKLSSGYTAMIREILCLKNENEFLELKLNPWLAFSILGIIGLLRTVLEVLLGITVHPKWYTLEYDVFFTMFFFVTHFCFWGALIIHVTSKLFKYDIHYHKIFSYIFCLQILQLLVPFFDWVGLELNIPYLFNVVPYHVGPFFSTPIAMSLGIIFVWTVAAYITLKVFMKQFKLSLLRSIIVGLICFNILYWPIYHLWPTFDTIFDMITTNMLPRGTVMGYGTFFMLSSLIGIYYYSSQRPAPPSWSKRTQPKRKRRKR